MPAYAASPYGAHRAIVARNNARRAVASPDDLGMALQEIMKDVPKRLATICGDTPKDSPNGLQLRAGHEAVQLDVALRVSSTGGYLRYSLG